MAYNGSNEEKKELLLIPKSEGSTEYIRVEQINFKDGSKGPSVDIRNMYTNVADIAPTKKGIRIPDTLAREVFFAAFKGLSAECQMDLADMIEEYMNGDDSIGEGFEVDLDNPPDDTDNIDKA